MFFFLYIQLFFPNEIELNKTKSSTYYLLWAYSHDQFVDVHFHIFVHPLSCFFLYIYIFKAFQVEY